MQQQKIGLQTKLTFSARWLFQLKLKHARCTAYSPLNRLKCNLKCFYKNVYFSILKNKPKLAFHFYIFLLSTRKLYIVYLCRDHFSRVVVRVSTARAGEFPWSFPIFSHSFPLPFFCNCACYKLRNNFFSTNLIYF